MPFVEYHLLLVLIFLVKSGISLDLRKNISGCVLDKKIIMFFAPLLGIKLVLGSRVRNEVNKILGSSHALKMNTYIKRLGQLGFVIDHKLNIDLILSNKTDNFAQFVLNYQMERKETSIPTLIYLLKTIEPTLKNRAKTMMLVDSSTSKKSSKNNKKKKNPMKAKGGVTKKKIKEVAPKGTCFH